MVDLDSNPTKLLGGGGRQAALMTRGCLTTFSIANDVAKYSPSSRALMAVFPRSRP